MAEDSVAMRTAQRDATAAELPSVTSTSGVAVTSGGVVGVATWRETETGMGGGVCEGFGH